MQFNRAIGQQPSGIQVVDRVTGRGIPLVELTTAKSLPVKQVKADFAPTVLNLTPALKTALGTHLPPATRRA
jgi:hypothetical protein